MLGGSRKLLASLVEQGILHPVAAGKGSRLVANEVCDFLKIPRRGQPPPALPLPLPRSVTSSLPDWARARGSRSGRVLSHPGAGAAAVVTLAEARAKLGAWFTPAIADRSIEPLPGGYVRANELRALCRQPLVTAEVAIPKKPQRPPAKRASRSAIEQRLPSYP